MIDSFFEVIRRQLIVIERKTIMSWRAEEDKTKARSHGRFLSFSDHHKQLHSPPSSLPPKAIQLHQSAAEL